jgi:hypothetical protein
MYEALCIVGMLVMDVFGFRGSCHRIVGEDDAGIIPPAFASALSGYCFIFRRFNYLGAEDGSTLSRTPQWRQVCAAGALRRRQTGQANSLFVDISETTQPIAGSSRRRHRPTSRSTTHSTIGQQLSFDDLEL